MNSNFVEEETPYTIRPVSKPNNQNVIDRTWNNVPAAFEIDFAGKPLFADFIFLISHSGPAVAVMLQKKAVPNLCGQPNGSLDRDVVFSEHCNLPAAYVETTRLMPSYGRSTGPQASVLF